MHKFYIHFLALGNSFVEFSIFDYSISKNCLNYIILYFRERQLNTVKNTENK